MYKPSGMAKKMIGIVCVLVVLFIVAAAIASIIFDWVEFVPFTIGVLMGGGVNVIRILLLDRLVEKTAADASVGVTTNRFTVQFLLRFVLTVVVLLVAALVPSSPLVLWGAAAGVITFPLSAYLMLLFKPSE